MDLQLKDEVAVVVGAAAGIGRTIALAFAQEGAHVVLIDLAGSIVELALEVQQQFGVKSVAIVADVRDYSALQEGAGTIMESLTRCDHLIHAAAIGSGKFGFPFWNLEPVDWEKVVQVNLIGAINVAHAFTPPMIAARRGTLLFLASIAGQIGSQTDPPYSASKAAIINFAQCAAKDLAPYDIRVNTLCPGMVKTSLNRSVWQAWNDRQSESDHISYEDWAAEKISRVAPLGRWQTPEDIANMAVFLASSRANNITGQTINIDGGQVMHW